MKIEVGDLSTGLGKMECALAFFDGHRKALLKDLQVTIIRQL